MTSSTIVGSIELTETMRLALSQITRLDAISVGERITNADTPEALEVAIARAQTSLDIWRAVEAGEMSLDLAERAEPLLNEARRETMLSIGYETTRMHRRQNGDELAGWGNDLATDLATYQRHIDGYVGEVIGLEALADAVRAVRRADR